MVVGMIIGILGGMVGFAAYELIHEVRSSKHKLNDRYHDE